MTDETDTPAPPPKSKPTDSRDDRLAARLRDNLRKRKEQARQRDKAE